MQIYPYFKNVYTKGNIYIKGCDKPIFFGIVYMLQEISVIRDFT